MRIAVDFDGVLHDYKHPLPGRRMGGPIEGARPAMVDLQRSGHTVIIYSARLTSEGAKRHIADWMQYYDIPYTELALTKPTADVYLDDRAVRFCSWPQAMKEIVP